MGRWVNEWMSEIVSPTRYTIRNTIYAIRYTPYAIRYTIYEIRYTIYEIRDTRYELLRQAGFGIMLFLYGWFKN